MPSSNLLTPPPTINPPTALQLSQKAPKVLSTNPNSSLPWPLSLLVSSESPETWAQYENLLFSTLRTGDDKSARLALDRLTSRFGTDNERVQALRGVYEEGVARNQGDLEAVLKKYEKAIREGPTNFSIRKRHVAVLKSLNRIPEATTALVELLDASPTDAEAWAELSDLYAGQGLYSQAIYAMEEVLLIAPNAWSAHARIASLHYLNGPSSISELTLALKHVARSIELNESYLRGYYTLKFVTSTLGPILQSSSQKELRNLDDDIEVPSLGKVQKLEELATRKLAEITRRYSAGEKGWTGFEESEVIAARELLNRGAKVVR